MKCPKCGMELSGKGFRVLHEPGGQTCRWRQDAIRRQEGREKQYDDARGKDG